MYNNAFKHAVEVNEDRHISKDSVVGGCDLHLLHVGNRQDRIEIDDDHVSSVNVLHHQKGGVCVLFVSFAPMC